MEYNTKISKVGWSVIPNNDQLGVEGEGDALSMSRKHIMDIEITNLNRIFPDADDTTYKEAGSQLDLGDRQFGKGLRA